MRLAPNSPRERPHCGRVRSAAALAVALACGTAAASCNHTRPADAPTPAGAARDTARTAREVIGPIEVEIQNRGTFEVIVYAVRGSIRRRLATVSPVSQATAVIPAAFSEDRGGFQFYARPIAGNSSFTSDNVYPQAGNRLVLTLQTRLVESTVAVQ